ncbi:MAG: cysteine--tRNA ligase [Defluviitaleaceae bacterium]|nr:cysteine--tRNA ligase [Defluviitaleaceae bacterium]
MKIYNTLARQKETLTPLTPGELKMYTCGQTTYNDIHMGNARFYVVFDAIRRYLEYKKYDVKYVQNFTDIDDKIIQKANEEGVTSEAIAQRYIDRTLEDLDNLNVKRATVNPRATEEIPEILSMITTLIEKGFAYENNGTVYYEVSKFKNYGKLSHKNVDDLEAGARVEVESGKRNPADFVLWKPAKPDEPKWASPWGDGRPGWHIECSAMIRKYLGDSIDIHGGGGDLVFPHHENEIAQTEAITGKDFARHWMHCGTLTVEHKKMSKSRGNFATLREVAEKYPHDVIRFYFISGHYRMPMEFTDEVLNAAAQGLQRIKNCYKNLLDAIEKSSVSPAHSWDSQAFSHQFETAMDDDFNTADAITAIFELVKYINTGLTDPANHAKQMLSALRDELVKLCDILGIPLAQAPAKAGADDTEIETQIEARQAAKKAKNFAEADRIRDALLAKGIVLEDTRQGVRWHRA